MKKEQPVPSCMQQGLLKAAADRKEKTVFSASVLILLFSAQDSWDSARSV